MCSLSRLWVGWEMSWSCGHNISLVRICVGDINGVNRNEGIDIILSERTSILTYFLHIMYIVMV